MSTLLSLSFLLPRTLFRDSIYFSRLQPPQINGALVYPAAGLLVMAIEAAKQLADASRIIRGFELKDCAFERALTIPQTAEGIEVHTSVVRNQSGTEAKNA